MSRARGLLAATVLALAAPGRAATVSLVVADVKAAASAEKGVSVMAFDRASLADPIEKGRFLAALQASDTVIAAADADACGWLAAEVEGALVHCLTPYDAAQVLDFARAAGWRRIAAVHLTGYEKVYGRLRTLARTRGIELVAVRVDRLKELTAAVPGAMKNAQAVWILGDPRLTGGAAFDYLVEVTLARRIPLIAPGAQLVARGAFLGADADRASMTRHAVDAANAAARGGAAAPGEVPGGRLAVNRVLARRWGVSVPGGAR